MNFKVHNKFSQRYRGRLYNLCDLVNKKSLRKQILKIRTKLDKAFVANISSTITDKLIAQDFWKHSDNIALYLPVKNEVDTTPILQHIENNNKTCYLPILDPHNQGQLRFIKYTVGEPLQKNQFGIFEPTYVEQKLLPPPQLDLVITPLLGFNENCTRLGLGCGYYDKTFAFKLKNPSSKPLLIGLAYETQKVAELNPDPWDVPLQMIITETNIYNSRTWKCAIV